MAFTADGTFIDLSDPRYHRPGYSPSLQEVTRSTRPMSPRRFVLTRGLRIAENPLRQELVTETAACYPSAEVQVRRMMKRIDDRKESRILPWLTWYLQQHPDQSSTSEPHYSAYSNSRPASNPGGDSSVYNQQQQYSVPDNMTRPAVSGSSDPNGISPTASVGRPYNDHFLTRASNTLTSFAFKFSVYPVVSDPPVPCQGVFAVEGHDPEVPFSPTHFIIKVTSPKGIPVHVLLGTNGEYKFKSTAVGLHRVFVTLSEFRSQHVNGSPFVIDIKGATEEIQESSKVGGGGDVGGNVSTASPSPGQFQPLYVVNSPVFGRFF